MEDLSKILKGIKLINKAQTHGIQINKISSDSRQIEENDIFVAISGYSINGHDYIDKAIEKGAKVIVYQDNISNQKDNIIYLQVKDSREALAIMASNYYDNPSKKLNVVGITGTNGKTTTVTLLYKLFTNLGYNCGLLSTIANYVGDKEYETHNTTSDPLTINKLMKDMVDANCKYCFMEVSSIGLEQHRVSGIQFKLAIFTNLTHDHLDYHKTFAEYLRCKKLLFDNLDKNAIALTNIDDKNGMIMVQNTIAKVYTYSCKKLADFRCKLIEQNIEGSMLQLNDIEVWTKLIGQHNAYNILTIYASCICLGADKDQVLLEISKLDTAKGRLETIYGKDVTVVIDYAHTPDALDNVCATLKKLCNNNQFICLFGCGGNRDKTKRPEMAKIAEKYADRIIVTSDNSRCEKTSDILNDIRSGFDITGLKKALFIEDRKEAIRTAIISAEPKAIILLAGKGHETYQIIGQEVNHFDEREIVKEVLEQINS